VIALASTTLIVLRVVSRTLGFGVPIAFLLWMTWSERG
jgi:hypothetical protein